MVKSDNNMAEITIMFPLKNIVNFVLAAYKGKNRPLQSSVIDKSCKILQHNFSPDD